MFRMIFFSLTLFAFIGSQSLFAKKTSSSAESGDAESVSNNQALIKEVPVHVTNLRAAVKGKSYDGIHKEAEWFSDTLYGLVGEPKAAKGSAKSSSGKAGKASSSKSGPAKDTTEELPPPSEPDPKRDQLKKCADLMDSIDSDARAENWDEAVKELKSLETEIKTFEAMIKGGKEKKKKE